MHIDGSSILITGAAGGLGTAMARELAARGAHLVLSGRNVEALQTLAAELDAEVLVADLTDRDDVDRVAERSLTCDVLVANAGTGGDPNLDDVTADVIDIAIDVNLRAPMVMSHAFAHAKRESGEPGSIVLVGSLAGLAATPGTRLYNATKFGLRGFALALAQELHGTPVSCTLIAPGFIRDAGMFHNNDIELPPGVRTKSPADVAAAVVTAITEGPMEVYVSPPELRAMSTLASLAPSLSAAVQRRLGVADRVEKR